MTDDIRAAAERACKALSRELSKWTRRSDDARRIPDVIREDKCVGIVADEIQHLASNPADDAEPECLSHLPKSPHNPTPSMQKLIDELRKECDKVYGHDGNKTTDIRIWLVRRSLERLLSLQRVHRALGIELTEYA